MQSRIVLALALVCAFALGALAVLAWRSAGVAADRPAVEAMMRDYLLAHPEVVRESLLRWQQAQEAAARSAQGEAVAANRQALLADPASPVAGNPAGDVAIVQFFDYRCPYCKQVAPDLEALAAADGSLRLVYKEFPILSPGSVLAAKAALAAARQDRYPAFHAAMMAHKGEIDEAVIGAVAGAVGLDGERLAADMADPAIAAQLRDVQDLAGRLGIRSTPTFVIGDAVIAGALPPEALRRAVAAARAQ